jgi:hypothetical protein
VEKYARLGWMDVTVPHSHELSPENAAIEIAGIYDNYSMLAEFPWPSLHVLLCEHLFTGNPQIAPLSLGEHGSGYSELCTYCSTLLYTCRLLGVADVLGPGDGTRCETVCTMPPHALQ